MIAPLGALMARSLRLDARAARPHVLRSLLGVVIVFALLVFAAQSATRSASGLALLWWMSWIAWWALLLVAAGRFASAITEEKEEGCLGLLRMAGLRPLAILLGKSATMLWEILLLIGALLPVAVLAVTLGGVSLGQVWATVALLAAWTVALAGLALLCSVLCRSHGGASALTLAVALVALIAPPLLASLAPSPATDLAWSLCSWQRLSTILAIGFDGPALEAAVATHVAAGAGCFLLAWLLFERCASDSGAGGEAAPLAGGRGLLPRPGRPGPGVRALFWKDFHIVNGGRPLLLLRLLAMVALVSGGFVLFTPDLDEPAQVFALLLGVGAVWQTFDVGIKLARVFAVELRWQTLAGIAVLPIAPGRQVAAKLAAVALSTLPATLVIAASLWFGLLAAGKAMDGEQPYAGAIAAYMAATLVTYGARIVLFWYICALTSLYVRSGAFFAAIGISFGVSIVEGIVGTILSFVVMAASAMTRGAEGMFIGMAMATLLSTALTAGLCVIAHIWFMRRWRSMPGR